ncbi:hypothetical protein OIE66_30800 [Nonomuraea sp. NBC_01738]|uniref:hypothetical protein n=1 Tax=Nonomuraea sp. NBC_01738 TaxID=2976003 RepID=UPI002E1444E1|nr:hypothetical protein OIE66_30800 [Nonomuraea sp. NBC_01738]
MLLYCFAVALATGGFLAVFYTPSGELVAYDGGYEPLRGMSMSAAYSSILDISLDVRGGLFVRQLHHTSSILLSVGAVVWLVLGRFRFALAVVGLALISALAGYGAADDLLTGTFLAKVPAAWWYGLHLLSALAAGGMLVASSRREAVRNPRTIQFVALSLGLTAAAFLVR